jgi:hypothetical protein
MRQHLEKPVKLIFAAFSHVRFALLGDR